MGLMSSPICTVACVARVLVEKEREGNKVQEAINIIRDQGG